MRITDSVVVLFLATVACASSPAELKRDDRPAEVSFDLDQNEIILQVRVNGKGPFNVMLDTGTDPSAFDLTTAKQLGLRLNPVGTQATGGGTGVNLAYETILSRVEVGDLAVKNLEAVAIDLSRLSERLGKPLHGVLGHSLLNGRIVQIDYPSRVVRFYSHPPLGTKARQPDVSGRTELPFRYADNVLVDDVFVNGKKVVANLDTGSDGTFKLTPAAVVDLGLEKEFEQAEISTSVGYRGVSENREGTVRDVTVGGISIDRPRVVFFGKGTGRDEEPWGINIGNEFLKDFVLTIDYPNKLITLERP